ncbi:MAG: hypothetical protein COT00_04200 [Candidatus Omnitrophica bacterium CG07_land_8_20_14_0_80_50_8]|nr:MAG: hypothetical protein COT00_04200 [Candidatus Omnitrophica bacterium CG07_land_8_20_14_0_80_50_8]
MSRSGSGIKQFLAGIVCSFLTVGVFYTIPAKGAEIESFTAKASADLERDREDIISKLKIITGKNMEFKNELAAKEAVISKLEAEKTQALAALAEEKAKSEHLAVVPEEKPANLLKLNNIAFRSNGMYTNDNRESLNKEEADAHYNLGVLLQGAGKTDDALREYSQCLALRLDDADTLFNMAIIFDRAKNDRKKAIAYYAKYLALEPKSEDVLKVRERIEELKAENKIWGDPKASTVKEKLGRW